MKLLAFGASCLILVAIGAPAQAKGGFFPTYHPKPCEGDSCRGDDPRSNMPCTGLLCSISSAKALQPPVTAAEAAEMQAHAAAAVAPPPSAAPEPSAKVKRKVGAKRSTSTAPAHTLDAKLDADRSH